MSTKFIRYVRSLTLLDALTTSITDPYGTMHHLVMERSPPPYLIRSILGVLLVLLAPIAIYQFSYDAPPADVTFAYAFGLSIVVAYILFIPMLTVFLRMVGVKASSIRILSTTVYSLTPIIPIMGGYYLGNYFTIGRLSIVVFLTSGRPASGDWYINLFPYCLSLMKWGCFLVFSQGVRVLAKMSFFSSILVATLCLIPLLVAFVAAVTLTETIYNGSAMQIWKYLATLQNLQGSL